MYIALFLMLAGIVAGRIGRRFLGVSFLGRAVFWAVLLLLFLLGNEIGANRRLFANLPVFGGQALAIALAAIMGSLVCAGLLRQWLAKRGYFRRNGDA